MRRAPGSVIVRQNGDLLNLGACGVGKGDLREVGEVDGRAVADCLKRTGGVEFAVAIDSIG